MLPGHDLPDRSFWRLLSFDTAAHIFVFGVLVLLMIAGLIRQTKYQRVRPSALMISVGFGMFYGGLIEIIQYYFIPTRCGDIIDFFADSIGCLLGSVAFYVIYGKPSTYTTTSTGPATFLRQAQEKND